MVVQLTGVGDAYYGTGSCLARSGGSLFLLVIFGFGPPKPNCALWCSPLCPRGAEPFYGTRCICCILRPAILGWAVAVRPNSGGFAWGLARDWPGKRSDAEGFGGRSHVQ